MARILHVDDKHEWREVVGRALADHYVDVADSQDQALELLQSGAPYHLALIDLHVATDDGPGDELLELVRARYPGTRRIVVAAVPARGDLLDSYGVEEVLITSEMAEADIRRVVEESLREAVPVDARIRRADLRRRYLDWQRRQSVQLDSRVHAAEMFAANAGTVGSDSRRRAQAALQDALALRELFRSDCADVARRIEQSVTVQEVLDAADTFDGVEGVHSSQEGR